VDFDDSQEPKIRRPALKHKIAVAYERNSDYGLALKHLDTALQEIPPRQPQQTAKVIVTKSLALFRKGLYEQAIRWGRLGLTLSKRSRDQHNLAYAYNILASSYLDTGNIKKAIRYRQAAIRLYEELGNLAGQAEANNNLGASYQSLGNQDLALHHFEIALALCERLGNFTNVAIAHNNVGEVLITLGRTDKAISHLLKVVETYEKKGDPLACSGLALVNLSRAYQRKNEYESALNCLERGKNLLRKAGARGLLVEALLQESELQLATSQIEPALTTCQKALRFAQDSGIRLLEARGLHILGRIDTARKLYAQAETGLQQSAALAKRINADYERGIALLSLAKLYMKLTDDKDSCKRCYFVLKQAAAVFQRVGAKEVDEGETAHYRYNVTAGSIKIYKLLAELIPTLIANVSRIT
jgi:tetratricopeptide (TPR) repeat protein